MQPSDRLSRSLDELRVRLHYVNRAWTVDNYEGLLRFYVNIVPKLLHAERCAIFTMDPVTRQILSKVGTELGEGDIEAPLEGSVVGGVISSGERIIDNELDRRSGFHRTADEKTGFVTRSVICAPIKSVIGERVIGAIEVLNKRNGRFGPKDGEMIEEFAAYLSMALDNISINREVLALSSALDRELTQYHNAYLGNTRFIAESEAMRNVLEMVRMVSATPVDVVIQGENGTGKELIARMIHAGSHRREDRFVAVNCAAIPESLMESEFFGYEKGAFTGAASSRPGRFEEANGGTLFLDEIADMPMTMQPKFLRAIQEGEGSRLGSNKLVRYDLRLISATNRDLRDAITRGDFREDLFYRLFSVEITVPPLRERKEDIVPLTLAFLDDVCRRFDKPLPGLTNELLGLFESYPWPGNVRQLRREVERLVALTPEAQLLTPDRCSPEIRNEASDLTSTPSDDLSLPVRVNALEAHLIKRALRQSRGNKVKAAELLGITRQGLHKKIRRLGLGRQTDEVVSNPEP
ncbi:MAG: GAF domain-containing protein [Gammaproteobacteria bacterium]|nr:GAF domain-containing protein [Gammaproteobacteria bacterium]NIR83605.1 GAF domain-containing protein [Gammaproteobacteria bacterium]NIR91578.1 GAF domain-containing protein [Gammaproteobacteria bacterium]NIU04767.1 GAF domain-containing protein [Gammaproteobacteria bacterium]NIV53117.1 GAF domain-containing protein [Gammaproteobacteria bacterium]